MWYHVSGHNCGASTFCRLGSLQRNMSVTVEVGLLSGRTAAVKAGLNGSVGTLKHRAQTALGVGKWRLLDGSGNILGARASIKRAQLQNGDKLTLHISRVQIYTSDAFFLPSGVMDPP